MCLEVCGEFASILSPSLSFAGPEGVTLSYWVPVLTVSSPTLQGLCLCYLTNLLGRAHLPCAGLADNKGGGIQMTFSYAITKLLVNPKKQMVECYLL